MKLKPIIIVFLILTSVFVITNSETTFAAADKATGSFYKSGTEDTNYVELKKVNDNIWIHTSYADYNGSRTPSNGIVAVSEKGLVLVDTPWNNEQTRELIKLTKKVFGRNISMAVITHAHADRIGGIDTLIQNRIDVRSTKLTVLQARKNKYKEPAPILDKKPNISLGNLKIETFYPGEGHTVDNIVVWFPQYKILFGGCLVKAMNSTDLGNIADANVKEWPASMKKVLKKYPDAKIVIPGHGNYGGIELIKHTIELGEK